MTLNELLDAREGAVDEAASDLLFHLTHDPLGFDALLAFEGLEVTLTEEDCDE